MGNHRPPLAGNAPTTVPHASWIDTLKLHTIDPDRDGDVAMASMPLPQDDHALVAFAGMTSQAVPIAWYPAEQGAGPGKPRQVLIMGIADAVPATLGLVPASADALVTPKACAAPATIDPAWSGPHWQTAIVEETKTGLQMREVNELVIEHAGRSLGIRMGIELVEGGYHWWEWLQVEQLWSGPVCTAIRAAGYIGVTDVSEDELFDPEKYNTGPWLHRHNWLFAEVYLQLFANGLARVTARHVNNRFFDQGRNLEGFVPVIAFHKARSPWCCIVTWACSPRIWRPAIRTCCAWPSRWPTPLTAWIAAAGPGALMGVTLPTSAA